MALMAQVKKGQCTNPYSTPFSVLSSDPTEKLAQIRNQLSNFKDTATDKIKTQLEKLEAVDQWNKMSTGDRVTVFTGSDRCSRKSGQTRKCQRQSHRGNPGYH